MYKQMNWLDAINVDHLCPRRFWPYFVTYEGEMENVGRTNLQETETRQ